MQTIELQKHANLEDLAAIGFSEEDAFREESLDRSLPFLTQAGSATLKSLRIGVAGCGGVGGALAETLARMGCQQFRLADPGVFDLPDINRQWGANIETMGRNKAEVYRENVQYIQPFAKVEVFTEGIQDENLDAFLEDLDVLVDCLDLSVPLALRTSMFARAAAKNIFSVTAPILGFGALIACADGKKTGMQPFLKILEELEHTGRLPEFLSKHLEPEHLALVQDWLTEKRVKVPSMAVTPMLAGSIAATEILNAFLGDKIPGGREPVLLPDILLVDLFQTSFSIHRLDY